MGTTNSESVEEDLAGLPPERQGDMRELRALVRESR